MIADAHVAAYHAERLRTADEASRRAERMGPPGRASLAGQEHVARGAQVLGWAVWRRIDARRSAS